jgi:hypothetical protein
MGYGQRVIIKFLVNDGLSADEIEEKPGAQFTEDAYSLRTVQFWIAEVQKAAKISTISLAQGDLLPQI